MSLTKEKSDLVRLLKRLKARPRLLTEKEIDDLTNTIGGSTRAAHRPEVKLPPCLGGYNRRVCNWTAIAEVVFSFLQNHRDLQGLQKAKAALVAETDKEERTYLAGRIEALTPIAATVRSDAIRLAVEWFRVRGVVLTEKDIENELTALRERAGLKTLTLDNWLKIKKKKAV